jgi:hypothetical protein
MRPSWRSSIFRGPSWTNASSGSTGTWATPRAGSWAGGPWATRSGMSSPISRTQTESSTGPTSANPGPTGSPEARTGRKGGTASLRAKASPKSSSYEIIDDRGRQEEINPYSRRKEATRVRRHDPVPGPGPKRIRTQAGHAHGPIDQIAEPERLPADPEADRGTAVLD